MRRQVLSFLGCSLFAAVANAQQPPKPPAAPCAAREHRQFDFWLGEWSVYSPDGKPAGKSRIESILDGCVVAERWTGAKGFSGRSFNVYNRETRRWEQYWVDQSGSRLHLSGGLAAGSMVLAGSQDTPDPKTGLERRERITWTPNADGSVRQLWESSVDAGKSWTTSFDGQYRRGH